MMIIQKSNLRIIKYTLVVATVCIIAGIISHYHLNRSKEIKVIPKSQYPTPRHVIKGFRYDGSQNGMRIISIRADKFTMDKKKLGFFKFGLMNEVRFENAHIELFGKAILPERNIDQSTIENGGSKGLLSQKTTPEDESQASSANQATTVKIEEIRESLSEHFGLSETNGDSKQLSFKDSFSQDAFKAFPVKQITTATMEPVRISLYNEQKVVSQITAGKAVMRFAKGDILFTGNVRMTAGSRILQTDVLTFQPDEAIVSTDRHFILKTPEKQIESEKFSSDVFLEPHNPDMVFNTVKK